MRSFPRTARRRMAAASVAAVLAAGRRLPSPTRSARDDLKDKQRKVEKSIDHAHDDLDHSSKRLRKAAAGARGRPGPAGRRPERARHGPRQARGRRASATPQMQAALAHGRGRAGGRRGRARRRASGTSDDQRRGGRQHRLRHLRGGRPASCWPSPRCSSRPPPTTSPGTTRSATSIVGREARAYDELHAAEVLLEVHERQVEEARDDVAVKRQAGGRQPGRQAAARDRGRVGQGLGRRRWSASGPRPAPRPQGPRRRPAPAPAARAGGRTGSRRCCAAAPPPRCAGPAPRPRRASGRGGSRSDRRHPDDARSPAGHLAVRLAHAPDLRLLGPARRHRLRWRLRPAHPRGRRRAAWSRRTGATSTATG